ncbi:hypothetical protein [Erythrobacter sp. QSSC1-22B]|uniref:hypothetical protein n=1 Tax=Erythrobacter sp. QSSC1-22B TaxID=1860125 RepID=UPI00143B7D76|nr:hypothetical protein [Erythrobacter sp. QSSC1-22B]
MQKRLPAREGAVLLGGERTFSTSTRPKIQANAAMRLRLAALLWSDAHREVTA